MTAYQSLRETAARIDLSSRGRIRVTGDDRARLLHAMCTNNIKDLVPGTGCYAFFLNAQGRILADANILCCQDYFLLDTEPETRAFLLQHLEKFIIADDVTLEDVTETTVAIGIEGPSTPPPPAGATIIRASSTGAPGFRIINSAGSAIPFPELPQASAEEARIVRLEHFFPRYGEDITSANIPQETGIVDALHFTKGCYLGQEIVERVRSRGHVNRMLVGLRLEGGAEGALAPGTRVLFDSTDVGETTSSAFSPALAASLAMAYIRVNAAKPGTIVSVAGHSAQVSAIKSSRTS